MKVPSLGLLATVVSLVLIDLHSATALAVTRSWDGGGGTDAAWTTDANWSSNIEPVAGDTAEFDPGSGFVYTVIFPQLVSGGDETTDRLIVGSNAVTFTNDRAITNYLVTDPATDELGRGVIIGEEGNDAAAALISHLGLLSTAAATLGHVAGAGGTLTLNQNNDQFNVTGSSASDTELIIGRHGAGVLNVSGGADVNVSGASGNALLGQYAGSSGTASISGTGSTLSVATSLVVGGTGPGTLAVTGGANVFSATGILGSSGAGGSSVTVTGANSTWNNSGSVYVGGSVIADGGNGTLSITNQGLVDIGGTLKLWPGGNVALSGGTLETAAIELAGGAFNWTSGTLRLGSDLSVDPSGPLGDSVVVGAGKLLEPASDLYVGNTGAGTLNIGNGAVQSDNGYIGYSTGSNGTVTIDGADALWSIFRKEFGGNIPELYVGYQGTGTLSIINGGRVILGSPEFIEDTAAYIGQSAGSVGTVLVAGTGSRLTGPIGGIENLFIGGEGTGILNITSGGRVSSFDASIGGPAGSPGTVTVNGNGSRFDAHDLFFSRGTLTITDGGIVSITDVMSVNSSATIKGNGAIVAGLVFNGGLVAPGTSPGALNIDGVYRQSSTGQLLLEVASAVSFDQLLVTGDATLGGTLTINLIDDFIPSVGQTFTILSADDVNGTFTTETLPSVPGLFFDVVYNPQSVVLTVSSAFTADFDEDGDVDADDLDQWQSDFGENALSDADNDGDSDGADFLTWQRQLGSGPPVTVASVSVPEPATLVLILAAAGLCARPNRQRKFQQLIKK